MAGCLLFTIPQFEPLTEKYLMNLKTITKLAAAIAAFSFVSATQALTITPLPGVSSPGVTQTATGNQTSQALIDTAILPYIGSATQLYKQDVGAGSDTGTFASSYKTTFANSAADPSDALIQYVSGPSIISNPVYLLVKDGNHSPAWYLFTIAGWNGIESLDIQDFWPAGGAISHVTLYGTQGSRVPDGGATVALLGVGLVGLGMMRRKIS